MKDLSKIKDDKELKLCIYTIINLIAEWDNDIKLRTKGITDIYDNDIEDIKDLINMLAEYGIKW